MTAPPTLAEKYANTESGTGHNFKRCECHPTADRHRFGGDLVCVRGGCNINWHQHQKSPRRCVGGVVPI